MAEDSGSIAEAVDTQGHSRGVSLADVDVGAGVGGHDFTTTPNPPDTIEVVTYNFENLYQTLVKILAREGRVSVKYLASITASTMVLVNKVPELTGSGKKELAIRILDKLVEDSGLFPEDELDDARVFLRLTLPSLIDTLVDAYKHRYDLKKSGQGCFKRCFGRR